MTPTELQDKIERHRQEIARLSKNPNSYATTPLIATEHSEIFIAASQLAEISSRRLERQTGLLIGLTWTLVGFTAVLIILTLLLVKHG